MSRLEQRPAQAQVDSARLRALDGLRGVAALVVVLHHTMLLNPNWPGILSGPTLAPGSPMWWFSFTPLKLFTAGWESVMVFFVLSGLVVSLPVLNTRGFNWVAYYPRRAARLMIPVIASVFLAAVWVSAIPQNSTQPSGSWLSTSSTPAFSWEFIASGLDLLGGDGQINNPLWSLRWELLFSVALPLFVMLAVIVRRWWIAGLAASVLLTWVGLDSGAGALSYLPAFFVGAMIATRLPRVRRFADRVNRLPFHNLLWLAFTMAGALLLIASWLTGPLPSDLHEITNILRSLTPVAAAMLVVACIGWRALGWLLSCPPVRFVGKISFSLYLTHVPILIFSAYLFAGQPLLFAQIFGVCLALVVSVAFWWSLEARTHGWSKRVGVWASARYSALWSKQPADNAAAAPRELVDSARRH